MVEKQKMCTYLGIKPIQHNYNIGINIKYSENVILDLKEKCHFSLSNVVSSFLLFQYVQWADKFRKIVHLLSVFHGDGPHEVYFIFYYWKATKGNVAGILFV